LIYTVGEDLNNIDYLNQVTGLDSIPLDSKPHLPGNDCTLIGEL